MVSWCVKTKWSQVISILATATEVGELSSVHTARYINSSISKLMLVATKFTHLRIFWLGMACTTWVIVKRFLAKDHATGLKSCSFDDNLYVTQDCTISETVAVQIEGDHFFHSPQNHLGNYILVLLYYVCYCCDYYIMGKNSN